MRNFIQIFIVGSLLVWSVRSQTPTKDPYLQYANDEHRLRGDLFKNYDVDLVPTRSVRHAITVKFGISVTQITVEEHNGNFIVNAWLAMKWNDFRLTWNPKDYDDVKTMRVKAENIWTPDITLYNSADINTMYDQTVKAIVEYDGNITWVPPERLIVKCNLDIKHFPYDTHQCAMMFGSWTHDGFVVDIQLDDAYANTSTHKDVVFAHFDGPFDGDSVSVTRLVQRYPCCEEPYPLIMLAMKFSRRSTMQHKIFVAPCILLGLLSSLIFLLPVGTGERTYLGMGIFSCLVLMVMWIGEILPDSFGKAPNILIYYMSIMIMTLISITLAAMTTKMRTFKHLPSDMIRRIVVDKFSCVTCVSASDYQYFQEETDHELQLVPERTAPDESPYSVSTPRRIVRLDQWQMIGTILDRMFFVLHFAITTVVSLSLLNY